MVADFADVEGAIGSGAEAIGIVYRAIGREVRKAWFSSGTRGCGKNSAGEGSTR